MSETHSETTSGGSDLPSTVTLYHGTTLQAADLIAQVGWQPIDRKAIVWEVADKYAVERDDLWSNLKRRNCYITLDERPNCASFATTQVRAANWAQRAPEARWEALDAAWRVRHPNAGSEASAEQAVWVFRQMLDELPAVITAAVPVDAVFDRNDETPPRRRGPSTIKPVEYGHQLLDPMFREMNPEGRCPCPAPPEWITTIEEVPRQVRTSVAAALLSIDRSEFMERAKTGEFGSNVPADGPWAEGWWSWDRFRAFL